MKLLKNKKTLMNSIPKILIIFLVFSAISLKAQKTNELTLAVNGPVAVLGYNDIAYTAALDDGIGFGLEYGKYLSHQWSVRTGVALQTYSGNAKLKSIEGAYITQDSENESFEFQYRFENYREEQRTTYIQIPLLAQYESNGQNRFFAAAGVKLGIITDSDYEAKATRLTTAGYYEQYDALLEAPKFAGFGDFGNYTWEADDLALKTNVMLSFETGLKFLVSEVSSFYVSAYIDYGLTNVFDDTRDNRLIEYLAAPEVDFTGNSILTTPMGATDTLKTLSFGFKLKYGLGF